VNLSMSRCNHSQKSEARRQNSRGRWDPKAKSDLIFIVAVITVLLAIAIVAILETIRDRDGHATSMKSVSCSSPSSGTIGSTPGRSFFEIPVRATCMSPLRESHGESFSPLLTTDDRSTLLLPGPSADRRDENNPAQRDQIHRQDLQDCAGKDPGGKHEPWV